MLKMNGRKFILYSMLFLVIFKMAEGWRNNLNPRSLRRNKEVFAFFPGVKIYFENGEIGVEFSFRDFFSDNVVEARQGNQSGGGQKPGPLQKIIRGIMMIPLAIQILSLPGVIAEIKMSLLRSLIVAKMALVLLIFNTFRNIQRAELVVLHKAPELQHFDHYYHPAFQEKPEENGWFGR